MPYGFDLQQRAGVIGEKSFTKIKVKNSIIDLDGDEMTRCGLLDNSQSPNSFQVSVLSCPFNFTVLLAGSSGMTSRKRSARMPASVLPAAVFMLLLHDKLCHERLLLPILLCSYTINTTLS